MNLLDLQEYSAETYMLEVKFTYSDQDTIQDSQIST